MSGEERRINQRRDCDLHSDQMANFENKFEAVASEIHKMAKSMESIAKGISNTVDSHRKELTDLNSRLTTVEQQNGNIIASRNVILVILGAVFSIMTLITVDYFSFKLEMSETQEKVELSLNDKAIRKEIE
jgi:phage host-nuclease inhibitor protein Gam